MTKHLRAKKKKEKDNNGLTPEKSPRSDFNWFPGHMTKALRKIKEKVKIVDIILELRDARSPIVTSNKAFVDLIGNKPKLIVLNKMDLADPKIVKLWQNWFKEQNQPFLFVNGLDRKSISKIVELSKGIIQNNRIKSNQDLKEKPLPKKTLKMMIIGLPNTGKSTIINKLANRNASKAADKPGQTQQQIWINVNKDLKILDTPGVIPPVIETDEQLLWLSALHAIPERVLNIEETACYVINHLLKFNPSSLSSLYKYPEDNYDLLSTLEKIAQVRGCIKKGNQYDYERVYKLFIHDFRAGKLGQISFGEPPIDNLKD